MDKKLTIKEHLNELRKRMFWIVIPSIIIFFGLFAVSDKIIRFLLNTYNINATLLSPLEYINTQVNLSVNLTLLFLIPMILTQIYLFTKPAIKKEHRRTITKYIGMSSIVAVLGLAFAYYIFIPQTLNFFKVQNGGLNNLWSLQSILDYINLMLISFALIFQLTIVIPVMDKIKLINAKSLSKFRIPIILICFTIAGIVTPSVNIIPQVVMAIPMYGSFEMGMLLSKFNRRIL